MDLVLYRPTYPKLQLGGTVNQLLAESVVATIEVKSRLDEVELGNAIVAARNVKNLERRFVNEYGREASPPKILSYVVAFDSVTENMTTVKGWMERKY